MNILTIVVSSIGVIGTLSSIYFAYLASKRKDLETKRSEGKVEGSMLSDIGYIKACVDRVEKNLTKVDERNQKLIERLTKVEKTIENIIKRVDELSKNKKEGE